MERFQSNEGGEGFFNKGYNFVCIVIIGDNKGLQCKTAFAVQFAMWNVNYILRPAQIR